MKEIYFARSFIECQPILQPDVPKTSFEQLLGWLVVLVYKKADGKPRIVTYNFITKYIWLAEGLKLDI